MSDETPQEPTQEPAPTPADAPTVPMPAAPRPPLDAEMPYTAAMDTSGSPGGNKGKRVLATVIALAVVLAAGGAAFAFFQLRGSSDALMSQVPASADMVATVYLNPAASQKVDLFRMTDKFPVLGSESDLTQRVNLALDQAGASVGLDHNDFQWIGSQAAVVVDFPGAAAPNIQVLVDVDDMTAAKATLDKARSNPGLGTWNDAEYKGVTVASAGSVSGGAYAFVGNTLVLSNTAAGVNSIIDTDQGASSLADSADFKATSDGLPDGRLAMVYVNVSSLLPLVGSLAPSAGLDMGALDATALQGIRGIGMTVSAEPSGLAMDFNASLDPSKMSDPMKALSSGTVHDNPLLSYVPPDAFAVGQSENVDAVFTAMIDQVSAASPDVAHQLEEAGITGASGLLSTLTGDLAFEVGPGTIGLPMSGALLLGTNNTTKFAAAVTKLKDLAAPTQSCSASATASSTAGQSTGVALPSSPASCSSTPAPEWKTEEYEGTTINYLPASSGEASLSYATVGDAGVMAISPDSIKQLIDAKAGSNITSNSAFTTAQSAVPSQSQFFYVDVQGVLQGIAVAAPDQAASMQQAVSLLEPVKAVAIGAESDATHSHAKFLIEIP